MRKGKVPRLSFHPPMSRSWLRGSRSQLEATSGTDPQTLPSCHHWRSQVPNPADPQAPQAAQTMGARSFRLWPRQTYTAVRLQRQGWGEVHCCLKAWAGQWAALARALEPSNTQSPDCSLGPSAYLLAQDWVSWRPQGRRAGFASYLTLPALTSLYQLLGECCLLGEGPTMVPTSGQETGSGFEVTVDGVGGNGKQWLCAKSCTLPALSHFLLCFLYAKETSRIFSIFVLPNSQSDDLQTQNPVT